MPTLTERIASFLKLADACLTLFDTITPTVGQPFFTGITPPKGFGGHDPSAEAADTIPQEILANGGWENELIEQAKGFVRELRSLRWGEDAVKSLLAFIRALKGSPGPFGIVAHGAVDRKLWEQVRADLEDAAELLRIDANGTPANGTPANGKPDSGADGTLSAFLASNPDASEQDALAAVRAAGFERSSAWLQKHPVWDAHFNQRIREYVKSHPGVIGPKQIGDALGYSKGTICGKQAYKELLPLLRARKAARREQVKQQRAEEKIKKLRSVVWRMIRSKIVHKDLHDPEAMLDDIACSPLCQRSRVFRLLLNTLTTGI